jgi:hypothetical protein
LSPRRLYLTQDTHWSPEGARLAASAVARRVIDGGAINRGHHVYVERPVRVRRLGDLVEMLQVPQIERALEPESLVCQQVVQRDSAAPYRDAPNSEVLVLGDSFLRVYEQDEPEAAGFIAHLARELGQPLTAVVNDGGASTLVRQSLARRTALLSNKRLVIWEFAERDIRYGAEGWQIVPLARGNLGNPHRLDTPDAQPQFAWEHPMQSRIITPNALGLAPPARCPYHGHSAHVIVSGGRRVALTMRIFTIGLSLSFLSFCVLGLPGCGEDNEAAMREQARTAKGTIPGSRTAQAQTQEEYSQITPGLHGAGTPGGPRPDRGAGYPGSNK